MYDWSKVPTPHMVDGVKRYVVFGIEPGSFLKTLLESGPAVASLYADRENASRMGEWTSFVIHELPPHCWGSPDKVEKWMKARREEPLCCDECKSHFDKEASTVVKAVV